MEQKNQSIQDWLQERKQLLYGLIPSKERIIVARILDTMFLVGVLSLCLNLYLRSPLLEKLDHIGGIAFMVITMGLASELVLLVTHGTFGMFVMRIAYVHGGSGERFDHAMYWEFLVRSIFINLKFSSLYEAYTFFNSPTNQSKAMEETGTYYVCLIAYKKLQRKRMIPFPRN